MTLYISDETVISPTFLLINMLILKHYISQNLVCKSLGILLYMTLQTKIYQFNFNILLIETNFNILSI